jgi:hypothetical protein
MIDIGITPVQSFHNNLVHKHSIDPSYLKKSFIIWSVKNKEIITNFERSLNIPLKEELGSKPIGIPHASLIPNGVMNNHQNSKNENNSTDNEIQYNPMLQNNQIVNTMINTYIDNGDNGDIHHNIHDINSPNPFHYDFYVTGNNDHRGDSVKKNKIENDITKRSYSLRTGRPTYMKIFNEISTYCANMNISRVAVISCGPSSMVKEAEQLCTYRHNSIAFDFHKEVFAF